MTLDHANSADSCSANRHDPRWLPPSYRQVLIFCPETVSGGPEALHQLAFRINQNGGSAAMVYTGPQSWCGSVEEKLLCVYDPACRMLEHYSCYNPQLVEEAPLDDQTLLVFPEVMAQQAASFRSASSRAIWWLSVDNALKYNPQLRNVDDRSRFFGDSSVAHFFQSQYAAQFLLANGAKNCVALSDFVDRAFFVNRGSWHAHQPPLICFLPRKGGALAAEFLSTLEMEAQEFKALALTNMSRIAVREALSCATVYIDFGHHPGKDRVPREACAAGAIVMLNRQGAARFFLDHPLDEEYLFNADEVTSGALATRLREIVRDPLRHRSRQGLYRQAVHLEAEKFDLEVRSFFFRESAEARSR